MSSLESNFPIPPFPSYPSADRFVAVGSQQEALQRVARAVSAWEALSLVIGPPGTGKSLLGQMLAKQFSGNRVVVLLGDATIETPAAMQRYLLRRLQKARGIDASSVETPEDLQLALIERIEASSDDFPGLLLLVDEAQTLSPEVLETIRILTNVMSEGRPRVSAVLLGGPKLDETLALPSLESLVQRVATRCYLHPFNNDETAQYISQVISSCGSVPREAIGDEAIRSIHRACSGVPRLINQLMTAAIDVAASADQARIDSQIIDRAWAVLQQLPGPLMDEPPLVTPSTVEFGPLSDDSDSETLEPQPVAEELSADRPVQEEASIESLESAAEWFGTHQDAAAGIAFEVVSIDCASADYSAEPAGEAIAAVGEAIKMPSSVPSRDDLFGTFDDEEDVVAGGPSMVSSEGSSDSPTVNRDGGNPTGNLEDSLHQEVLQLRSAAAGQLQDEGEPEAGSPSPTTPAPRPSTAQLLWLADDESTSEPEPQDDRDMLIIEDDIRVEGGQLVGEKSAEPPAEPVSVDFQGMLAKMRAPRGE